MVKKILTIGVLFNLFLISILPLSVIGNNTLVINESGNNLLEVDQIYFNYGEESNAITLWDSETKNPIFTPEFDIDNGINNPAAFVKGSEITIKVKFSSNTFSNVQIKALGTFGGFNSEDVAFQNGESDWIFFTCNEFVPSEIKNQSITWDWQFYNTTSTNWEGFDTTVHRVYLLNKKPIVEKVWKKLADWTTTWCTGLSDEMDLVDAILYGFVEDKYIKYGFEHSSSVANTLRKGYGLCGDLSELFHSACGTQGVTVIKFAFIIQGQIVNLQFLWKYMIILNPGLGRDELPANFVINAKVVNDTYPYPKYYGQGSLDDDVDEYAIRAWNWFDHAINLFEYEEVIYLYDLSYGKKYENVFDTIPDSYAKKYSSEVPLFRSNYFNKAVDFLQGKIYYTDENGNRYKRETFEVNTTIVPDEVGGKNQILFRFFKFNRARDYRSIAERSRLEYNPLLSLILEKFPIIEKLLSSFYL